MRSGVAAVQNTLTPPAQNVLRHAIQNAQSCKHTHVQPLHVALALLSHGGPLLRQACADLHSQASHGLQQCHALELCFIVALDRLPTSSSNSHPLALSNALVAALRRAQAHQKRGCPEQQPPPVSVKVELEQLIISILEDPSVSRVMKEAGFVSQQVKFNLENAISLSSSRQQNVGNYHSQKPFPSDSEPPLVGCVEARPPVLPSPWITLKSTEDPKSLFCLECTSHFNTEYIQLQAQESPETGVADPPLPSWLQKEKDLKSEKEKWHLLPQKLQDLQQKWQSFCRTSHSPRNLALFVPPHSRMESSVCNNNNSLGLMAANSVLLQSVDFTSLPTPKPNGTLNLPHWTRSLPSVASPEGPPRSIHSDAIDSNLQALEKHATSVSEDASNKVNNLQLGGLKPIEQPRGQLSPLPLSRLHTNLPKPSTNGCPLRSPLSALKASKPLSKSPLMTDSSLAQKLPPKRMSSLSQPIDTSLKNGKPPSFFDQKAAERLKHVYKGVLDKVSWQRTAVSQISAALVNTQSGMGKLRGLAARADTWLLLLGPDQIGKRLVADALAELIMGHGNKPVCFGLIQGLKWSRKDEDGVHYPRSRTTLDSFADALRTNPLCVMLLENIDQADSVLRMNLAKAMETGKFTDSSARQVNVGNAIILMTSNVGTESPSAKDNPFSEEKISLLYGARMKLALEPPMENKEVVLQGDHDISVVKDASLAAVVDNENLRGPLKRKSSGFLKQALPMHCEKRPKLVARTVPLDLNLSAEENEAGACHEENGSNQESKACAVLTAAEEELSPRFFNLVDNAVVFESFDIMKQANWVLSQLADACSGFRVEVDFQLLEHMVGTLWRTPGGNQAFETWVKEKLKSILNAFTGVLLGDKVLRFVYEDSSSKDLCSASALPLIIEVGSG